MSIGDDLSRKILAEKGLALQISIFSLIGLLKK